MPNQVQSLRSATAGARPSGRLAGELYVNTADAQIGVVLGSSSTQDFVAIRFFSASASYAVGDLVTYGGTLYRANSAVSPGAFNASQWTSYLLLSGGTLTGTLTLAGDPVNANEPATKAYVDAHTSGGLTDAPNDGSAYGRLSAAWAKVLALAGGTLTGLLTLPRSAFPINSVAANGATSVSWLNGEVQKISLGSNSTITTTGWPASGIFAKLIIDVTNFGAYTLVFSGVIWSGGSAPTMTSGSGKRDVYALMTNDGGTTVLGSIVGQNYS